MATQLVGQLALVAVIPVLTRTFTPAEFGSYQIALALGVLVLPIATLRLEFVIPASRSAVEVHRLLKAVRIAFAGVLSAWLVVAGVLIGVGSATSAELALCGAMVTASYGWMAIDNAFLIRSQEVSRLAWRNMLGGLLAALLQLGSILIASEAWLLCASILVGRSMAILVTRRYRPVESPADAVADGPGWTLRRGFYGVLSGLTSSLALQSVVLYSSVGFGAAAAGYVGTAQRSAAAPLAMIGQGLSQNAQTVLAPLAEKRDPKLRSAVAGQVLSLVPLGASATVAMAVFGPMLAVPIFGAGWELAGLLIAIMAVPTGMQLVLSPVTPVFMMLGAERSLFRLQLLRLVLSVGMALVLQLIFGSFVIAIAGFSLGATVSYVLLYFALVRLTTQEERT